MAERIYCSQANDAEPMHGTADVVDVWLLLEYRPAWKAKAVDQSDLATEIREWIGNFIAVLAEQGLKVRPQLIRQPELDRAEVRMLIGHGGRLLEFTGRGYGFLQGLDPRELIDRSPLPGARLLSAPRYFVCTNGQRDLCCARFGLPVYNSLRGRFGERVWQVSHVGGHRFAPNVLVLPQGVLYGRVHPDLLGKFVEEVEAGELSFAHLRGRSCYPKHVQAAEGFCARSHLKLLHVDGDDQAATVTFAGQDESVRVSVARSAVSLDVLSSCENEDLSQVFSFRAV